MKHVKSNVNILKPMQEKMQNNNNNVNLKISKSNNNIKNPKNNLKISEKEMRMINNNNNLLINFCEKSCKNSFSSIAFNNNNKTIKNSLSPNKIFYINKKNKTSTNTIFNTNNNNYIENNNSSNRGISIRLNFKNKIINNNFSRRNRLNKNTKKKMINPHTPKNINLNSGCKSEFNLNEKIKEKDKQITLLQKDLLQSQKLLNQLQEEKQKEISSTYNSIKRVDSFINNNNNNSYLNNNNSINTNYNKMKKYSSLSNFFVSKTDKNLNVLRTFYGKSRLISNKSNSKRTIYNTNYNNRSKNRIKNVSKNRKKNNLNIFTNPSTHAKFQIFKNNIQNKNKICKTRNNIHKNYNFNNFIFNSGSKSNMKQKNKGKNFMRALSYSPNKILTQFLNQYESNCKTSKNTFRKNINIKSTSPSSAQNRVINKRMKNVINNKRSKDLDYIINKGEDLKNRMRNLLNNYISLSSDIKKKYSKTEVK